jgi:hypothetical protein
VRKTRQNIERFLFKPKVFSLFQNESNLRTIESNFYKVKDFSIMNEQESFLKRKYFFGRFSYSEKV